MIMFRVSLLLFLLIFHAFNQCRCRWRYWLCQVESTTPSLLDTSFVIFFWMLCKKISQSSFFLSARIFLWKQTSMNDNEWIPFEHLLMEDKVGCFTYNHHQIMHCIQRLIWILHHMRVRDVPLKLRDDEL